jgi:hypothetical protein
MNERRAQARYSWAGAKSPHAEPQRMNNEGLFAMTARTKSNIALAAMMAALSLTAAAPAFADPGNDARVRGFVEGQRANAAPQAQTWRDDSRRDDWRRDEARGGEWRGNDGRRDDWRDARPDYRNPNAFVNISFRERFERMEWRIQRGIDEGSLTRREARWLWRQLEDTRARDFLSAQPRRLHRLGSRRD